MSLAEDIIFADPALQSALFDKRRFAPKAGHEAIVNIQQFALSELTVLFQKAAGLEHAEYLQRRIRAKFFLIRSHCDGWFIDLPGGDSCQHVEAFRRGARDGFAINHRARTDLWYRHRQRPPPPWL